MAEVVSSQKWSSFALSGCQPAWTFSEDRKPVSVAKPKKKRSKPVSEASSATLLRNHKNKCRKL